MRFSGEIGVIDHEIPRVTKWQCHVNKSLNSVRVCTSETIEEGASHQSSSLSLPKIALKISSPGLSFSIASFLSGSTTTSSPP